MPLVRAQVRNEYGLGQPELYKEVNREDPKAVLDSIAVAGLVGILRQLGDLAEFAAEVFHGLQEQVMSTASRSHKLTIRVQRIEAALPPLEKAVLAQTSHIHFAYTAGSEWHPRIRNEKNLFIYNDLPRFIMDSYEVVATLHIYTCLTNLMLVAQDLVYRDILIRPSLSELQVAPLKKILRKSQQIRGLVKARKEDRPTEMANYHVVHHYQVAVAECSLLLYLLMGELPLKMHPQLIWH
ncbi:hypothetical protein ES319_A05G161800v1 [Gossypium barbadense]|uniref:Protein WAVE n=2 Tax=Gossypium TaxID=3633 RepID=A0A5J5VP97_GOSBA|nr:hypothetical protein ES319_A05G161800v1 [Gossypium barbadense]TYH17088.1 hypothetical protein ES288_A05G165700v1 [Gossypium darwinii]